MTSVVANLSEGYTI